MADLAEEAALPLEVGPVPGVAGVHQDGVEEFGRAGKLAQRGPVHFAVGSRAEGRTIPKQTELAEAEGELQSRHVCLDPALAAEWLYSGYMYVHIIVQQR